MASIFYSKSSTRKISLSMIPSWHPSKALFSPISLSWTLILFSIWLLFTNAKSNCWQQYDAHQFNFLGHGEKSSLNYIFFSLFWVFFLLGLNVWVPRFSLLSLFPNLQNTYWWVSLEKQKLEENSLTYRNDSARVLLKLGNMLNVRRYIQSCSAVVGSLIKTER